MTYPVSPKTVCITGASSGIGEATAHAFAKIGANLILVARREEQILELKKFLESAYSIECHYGTVDVRDKNAVNHFFNNLPEKFKKIDVLVNNAGLALSRNSIQDGDFDEWDTMIDTNIKGFLYVARCILQQMIKNNHGHIINIGSIAGHECYPQGNVYAATKHAVNALSQSMRLDLLGSNIRVTEIAPGAVRTEFSGVRYKDMTKGDAFYETFIPLEAEDVADAILYCATRPLHVDVSQLTIMPTVQASVNYISYKKSSE